MDILYGNGRVELEGSAKAFDIAYKGRINIINNSENLLISANKNRIVGVMLNTDELPNLLFRYAGEFRMINAQVTDGVEKIIANINTVGLDYWEIDKQNWEDDSRLWGENNGRYRVGAININKDKIIPNDKYEGLKKQASNRISQDTRKIIDYIKGR